MITVLTFEKDKFFDDKEVTLNMFNKSVEAFNFLILFYENCHSDDEFLDIDNFNDFSISTIGEIKQKEKAKDTLIKIRSIIKEEEIDGYKLCEGLEISFE